MESKLDEQLAEIERLRERCSKLFRLQLAHIREIPEPTWFNGLVCPECKKRIKEKKALVIQSPENFQYILDGIKSYTNEFYYYTCNNCGYEWVGSQDLISFTR